jgi:class 3 adenylate cyclase
MNHADVPRAPVPPTRYHGVMPDVGPLRSWQRLSTRVAALFVAVTLLAVALVVAVIYEQQRRELTDTLGSLLLNVARTGTLLIDPVLHAEVERNRSQQSGAYRALRAALAAVQDENGIATPIYTLADYDAAARQARFVVTSRGPGLPGEPYPLVPELIEPLGRAFREGVATHTSVYRNQSGTWITAFAPIRDGAGRTAAVLDVDYRIDVYLEHLRELRNTVLGAAALGALVALVVGLGATRRVTRPITALTEGVARVAGGDLSRTLPVTTRDEVGRLTGAFNDMVEGLRQRDFIRDTFGRYVSPEVARTLLASPEALQLGGEKREVTVLMSDLRGYTRFAEEGDPAWVMGMLNDYLGRMTEIITAHGGTINEFIGDAIFAVFNAPLAQPDHAERAAASALAMQNAMADLNRRNAEGGRPRFEMGIGINTGEAVVGNIGSEQRAKYAVVGAAVNLAARVEGCTVGGQVFLGPATHERIQEVAEVGPPIPVEVKGVGEPVVLRELFAIGGRWSQRRAETGTEHDPAVAVALPAQVRVIDGKVVSQDIVPGVVVRLGPRQLELRSERLLPPLTNVRMRVSYPGLGYDSGDLYGKVTGEGRRAGDRVAVIRLTSVDPEDRQVLEMYLGG